MGREENIKVFQDTEQLCRNNEKIKESVDKATEKQKLILETDFIAAQRKDYFEEPAQIVVSKKRTFAAARCYKGFKTAVLNFASASNPGGGVVNGARAQEECLCRCSGLYFSLRVPEMLDRFYQPHRDARNPLHNDDIIYTPGVTVFKTDTANPILMPESDWYDVDVITCAAPNLKGLRQKNYQQINKGNRAVFSDRDLLKLHEKRLRRILEVALSEGVEAIVLGAFGCGAFENNPEVVALANRNVIDEYLYAFRKIEFAIYCSNDERNYKVFDRVLKGLCQFSQKDG